ncbi:YlzJ-like family protein [Ethanoligenens harbinense]|uniref:Uncharacterized protein n=1 Tax=Ethanoligenens harbinense (strain DSM 18485 / JCM 12961 / CGMCC 1.5033 / YUAN-3) TaxID=663278 RepID=E6U6W3_ETHHY|nr:YlzJ-like family protein [Ethanoligenens harbinense]ADU26930.1 hypothetical protein Ethha_1392 [Ethanoligenens harbinense YUAN-3]AVQ96023.1 ribonuclease [Ethanoligenens harbinense YUAN-3]AYF38684.1 ribonuclease [Ethanoligenens harbinense]AYF41431.1 ribonuclease [Ethanoligenens harbinense]QCN92265.1 ribonuclease [Ethanoligenens harbinense]
MLLYTVMPYDAIFGEVQEETDSPAQQGISAINGGFVEWTRDGGVPRVARLISTDPSAYLRADYAPGAPWFPKG